MAAVALDRSGERARTRFKTAADHIPLPAETLAGVVAAILAKRVRPLRLPAWAGPAGLVFAGGGLAVVLAAWRERGLGSLEEPEALVTTGLHRFPATRSASAARRSTSASPVRPAMAGCLPPAR